MQTTVTTPIQDERYLLLGALGQGGMASVFRAFDRLEQKIVALKVVDDTRRAGPHHPLSVEFDAWAALSHPNVVEAYALGRARSGPFSKDTPYLVLEHVDGGPVHRVLGPGRIEPSLLEQLTVQLLRGLTHVHAAGLVHRDLKPANVLVGRQGDALSRIKLTDFGLAAPVGSSEAPGTVTGSLPFVAPEAFLGAPVDGRADLYGLGILLYRLATGEMPVRGESVDQLLRWHLAGPPADPRGPRPEFPERLARFIRRLTQRSVERRPASARQALELLGSPAEPCVKSPPPIAGRAARAQLRLALDAARSGSPRLYRLPADPRRRSGLTRSLRSLSQIHGLSFHELGTEAPSSRVELGRTVLRLLLERPAEVPALMRRFALDRSLPLRLLAGHPVWDHTRPAARDDRGFVEEHSRRIVGFVLDCARSRPMVVHAEPDIARDPLLQAVISNLEASMSTDARAPLGGGLLLALG